MARQCYKTIIANDNIIAALEDAYGIDLDGASDSLITQSQNSVRLTA